LIGEASALFVRAIKLGMFSRFPDDDVPKYVWAVDEWDEVYEAKRSGQSAEYHGYRLADDDKAMRVYVLKEWKRRWSNP
jgi:hypothetical protein